MQHARTLDKTLTPQRRTAALVAALAALAFVVIAALAPTFAARADVLAGSIFAAKSPVSLTNHNDTASVEVGTKFRVLEDGEATGLTFWKTQNNTGTHVGTLWSSTGRALAKVTFTDESTSGWQTATFSSPVDLTAGSSYTVSYLAPKGQYAATYDYKATSMSPDVSIASNAGVFRYGNGGTVPTDTYRSSVYWVDVLFTPTTSPLTPPPTSTTEPTTPATDPTTPATEPTTPTTPPAPSTGFPTSANTGVPAGTALTAYTGSCTITTANTVIDAKTINCNPLAIRAKGVVISRSLVNGTVYADTNGSASFTISDSDVKIGNQMGTGIGDGYFTAQRVEVTGGNRSINCFINCTVDGSYVHGQFTDNSGVAHESGIRMGSGSTITNNTISCDAPDVPPDAGCSAALTGYGDFAIVQNNTISGNQFLATTGGYCAYGGSTQGKPYSAGVNNIRFTDNVFNRGNGGKCGYYGAITSFDASAPGNVWSNNTWDDGTVLKSAN
ncbi:DUF4082 domain-containing protein [Microbacterium sp. AZCO]|uniref:DUF4082 domain-containing protein n=1 Tax=Microbacterium sp. AZCO TaxID=3142976 RepID=UPI0031F3DB6B